MRRIVYNFQPIFYFLRLKICIYVQVNGNIKFVNFPMFYIYIYNMLRNSRIQKIILFVNILRAIMYAQLFLYF